MTDQLKLPQAALICPVHGDQGTSSIVVEMQGAGWPKAPVRRVYCMECLISVLDQHLEPLAPAPPPEGGK